VTRTHRFLGGLGLGYFYLGLVTVVGLWLTPFLLGRIGQHDYGLWLITTQILGYLMLLDLGVVALAPRETAFATGRALGGAPDGDVAATLARFRRVVRWQVPMTAVAATGAWWFVVTAWPELRWPLGVILAAFIVAFPFRLYNAALQGLQDLAFLGKVQLYAWAAGTSVTIVLVLAHVGLEALAAGWVVTQAVSAIACGVRIRRHHPQVWTPAKSRVTWDEVRGLFGRSGWISLGQVGQVFLNGSDILVLGALLGPAATVPYACTGKLIAVLANHPQLLMQTAAPALAEMRVAAARERLVRVALALMRAMLVISGGVACLVLAMNETFVTWWVGPAQFAGRGLTALLVAAMLVRHFATTMTYALYSFGHERRLSLTALADGVVAVGVTAGLLAFTSLGLWSAAIGSLAGVALVNIPATGRALTRELGIGFPRLLGSLRGWAVRFAAATAVCVAGARLLRPEGLAGLAAGGLAVGVVYAAVMFPLALEPPLGHYVRAGLSFLGVPLAGRREPAPESRS
jgi:O-antigen/teichoic acid export membrane protein